MAEGKNNTGEMTQEGKGVDKGTEGRRQKSYGHSEN